MVKKTPMPASDPIRSELFSAEQLEQFAATLAVEHVARPGRKRGRRLLPRLRENARVLLHAQHALADAGRRTRTVSPAAEWLLNNFHLVEEQIREIREDLPPGFYRELPKLASGPLEGYPRVYGVAWSFVAHTDSRIDLATLRRFMLAYQRVTPLTIGELWALAISLRLVLVENLRRLAERIVARGAARERADAIADVLLGSEGAARPVPADVLRMLEEVPFSRPFAVALAQRLREQDPAVTPALEWLDRRIASEGTTAEDLVHLEHQEQVANHATVRNVITSMRLLSSADWADFFESVSLVHEALCEGSRVAEMDFPTRDRYRHAVEDLARGSAHDELEVARRAVALAAQAGKEAAARSDAADHRFGDPGYYLISGGRHRLERELDYRVRGRQWLQRAWVRAATPLYLGSIVLITLAVLALPVALSVLAGVRAAWVVLLALLALCPASDLAVDLVHRFVTRLLGPRRLPKLELARGVPSELRTLVAIPMLLTDESEIEEIVQRLEVHYLANPDSELRFALLSDWGDAPSESLPEDAALVELARYAIGRLNERHGPAAGGGDRFWFLHRRRLWNEREGVWMGWERKRGKLRELNRLLRGATDTTFMAFDGQPLRAPSGIRYVITLDADSRLPREAARRLVGAMAHPLNLPRLDPARRSVVEGHGLLQPRVTPMLPEVGWGTLFQFVFSGPRGIDPYAFAVSDVYQDLFGEGIYTGKGIYDVDAFEQALADRVPDDTQLSHDLFEGLFARAGFVSDVEVFEGFPGHYEVAVSRQHRWVRGDWQLLPWVIAPGRASPRTRRVPPGRSSREAVAIPAIGRWKMIDNLRRSLSAPATFGTLLAGWCLPGVSAALWTLLMLGASGLPAVLSFFTNLFATRQGVAKRSFLRGVARDLAVGLSQAVLRLVFLAHAAWVRTDAIVRTLWRLSVSRRHLLEWVPAAQAHRTLDLEIGGFYRRMIGAIVLAAAAAALVASSGSDAWAWAAPFIAAWVLSPMVGRWVSLPPQEDGSERLSPEEARDLRAIARRTWVYFERFFGPEFQGLPADNFQETPLPVAARRTSPTNIGLALLSTVAANDFGWIGTVEMVDRCDAALASVGRLELFRGHLYNWYGTDDLAPLEPRYVSTVDSGNLAAHLLTLKQACLERVDDPALNARVLDGIGDALELLRGSLPTLTAGGGGRIVTSRQLEEALRETSALLSPEPTTLPEWTARLGELSARAETLLDIVRALGAGEGSAETGPALEWALALSACVASHTRDLDALEGDSLEPAESLANRLAATAGTAARLMEGMDFTFLYDESRDLFAIGYRPQDGSLDPGHYDLLASEARLTSFVAIARGDVPVEHWFHLGRPLSPVGRGSALLSWSGSMFEYLMPDLVLEAPSGSLLQHTNRLAVRRQVQYGKERGVPWGISEAAYNARDLNFNYQYSNFGVSGLGLKRGLAEDLVVAPYATALAAMVDPAAASANFARLASVGALGRFGFYESIDYTTSRLPEGVSFEVVKAYMAHHQGMTILALANVLLEAPMRRRFGADPIAQATDLLLQERTPVTVAVARTPSEDARAHLQIVEEVPAVLRRFRSPHDPTPRTHLLSNGRYSVMVTAAGSGYSRWRGLDVTRWREDTTCDPWGTYVFLAEEPSGRVWSAGYQPSGVEADSYEAVYAEDSVEIHRTDGPIATTLRVVVSTEDDAEIRQVTLTNRGTRPREIEITSYAEVVLAAGAADAAHPAYSNLFVQTEFVPALEALLAGRRPREREEPAWAAQVMTVQGEVIGTVQYETDRARFLGRGRSIRDPISIEERRPLSNTSGTVLDPVFSLRRRLVLPAGATAIVHLATVVARSREEVLALAGKYRDLSTFDRVSSLAWTQAQVQLRHLGISADEAHLFQQLASRILYSDAALRAPAETLLRNRNGPSALWGHGISGDIPIVLVRIDQVEDQGIVRQILRAHEYWRMKGLGVDLVIVNEQPVSYSPELTDALDSLLRAGRRAPGVASEDSTGRVFVLRGAELSAETRASLAAAARVVLLSRQGTLAQQVLRQLKGPPASRPARPIPAKPPEASLPPPRIPLEFFNGMGGFSEAEGEYVILLGERQWTPAPWLNVIANPSLGCLVSESGSGYTWAVNSRENQLTPWSNDPVSDPPGEAFYLRDDDTGEIWSPTPLPIRGEGFYVVRHGQGYSRFEYEMREIASDLTVFVAPEDPVKISRLAVENRSESTRTLTFTAYVEWVLGPRRATGAPFIVTELDSATGALFARNPWNEEHAGRVAFADIGADPAAWTADRAEFVGRNGGLQAPSGLARGAILSRRAGACLDPCAALQVRWRLAPGERREAVFLLGEGRDVDEARQLVVRHRSRSPDVSLAAVRREWEDTLTALQVRTPDRSMDLMLNRWLLYQALACRVRARAALYQAGGAWGFRDQLQDGMSFTVARRELTREHLLRAASRQFEEGDVQHWWHEPSGRGVRTRISDDRIWLVYATHHYLEITGDRSVLDEPVGFLAAPPLAPGEVDRYFQPETSKETAPLYEHCARALDRSLAVGRHGLPLMGSGDWNDGMNRVGEGGQGESVWLGWFLHTNLYEFARIAEERGETRRALAWREHSNALKLALERHGWDGDWYRRAFFDDGTPLGSAVNDECRIDSIVQSWGVISGAADPERGRRAMAAVDEHLIRRGDGLVLLFTPPFDRTPLEPGYIKGYAPGVRENGGQYTHAAVWAMIAFAALGDGDKAGELFAILNPINHASTRSGLYRYKIEPYVMAGDVYSERPHTGRGGWSWYTGAAGWMYRAGIEWILGFRLRGTSLHLDPCIPRTWPRFEIAFRYHSARYRLVVENPRGAMRGVTEISVDGAAVEGREIPLADDGREHRIAVLLG
jgi:cyclic beta-1,2-glucan synthetase